MSLLIGIDPGLKGAVAAINEHGEVVALQETPVVCVKKGKKTRHEYSEPGMAALLRSIMNSSPDDRRMFVVIEDVHSMPKQGVASSFHFGVGYGIWRGIIAALRLPCARVGPRVWKAAFKLSNDKGQAIKKALRLYPQAELSRVYHGKTLYHDGRAEALLLAHYALKESGASKTVKTKLKPSKSKR